MAVHPVGLVFLHAKICHLPAMHADLCTHRCGKFSRKGGPASPTDQYTLRGSIIIARAIYPHDHANLFGIYRCVIRSCLQTVVDKNSNTSLWLFSCSSRGNIVFGRCISAVQRLRWCRRKRYPRVHGRDLSAAVSRHQRRQITMWLGYRHSQSTGHAHAPNLCKPTSAGAMMATISKLLFGLQRL